MAIPIIAAAGGAAAGGAAAGRAAAGGRTFGRASRAFGRRFMSAGKKGNGLNESLNLAEERFYTSFKGSKKATIPYKFYSELISGFFDAVTKVTKTFQESRILSMEMEQNVWMSAHEKRLKAIETGGTIVNRKLQQFGKTQNAVLSSAVAQITKGATEGAYETTRNMNDVGVEAVKNMYDTNLDIIKMQNANRLTDMKLANENLKLSNKQTMLWLDTLTDATGVLPKIIGGPIQSLTNGVSGIVQGWFKIQEAESDIALKRLEMETQIKEKTQEFLKNVKSTALETSQRMVNQTLDLSKTLEKTVMETEKHAKEAALLLGISGQNAEKYTNLFFNAAKNLQFQSNGKTFYLDKDYKDITKFQTSYVEATGRNQEIAQKDMVKSFLLGHVLNDDQLAASLLGDMDYFNKTIENGTDLIYEMFQAANKAGVSNKKFAKDLQQNLKMAQKYTFKGGIHGMMEMAIWAQKTRFNLQTLDSIVDKGLTNGLEGVIQQSAKLQVLGGNASLFSNPLAMLYEFGNDPGAAAQRVNEMVKGFGRFNNKTGEVDFSMTDSLQLRAIADAYGIDATELRNQATQFIKNKQIDKQLNAEYTDEEKALIYSKAQLDKESGRWVVTIDGKSHDINSVGKNDWSQLMPTEEAIEDYVGKIYNIMAQDSGAQKYSMQKLAEAEKTIAFNQENLRIEEALRLVNDTFNFSRLKDMISKGIAFTTESQKLSNDQLLTSTETVATMFDIMRKSQIKAIDDMNNSESDFNNALSLVQKELYGDAAAVEFHTKALIKAGEAITKRSWMVDYEKMKETVEKFKDGGGELNEFKDNLRKAFSPDGKLDREKAKYAFIYGWNDMLDAAENSGFKNSDRFTLENWSDEDIIKFAQHVGVIGDGILFSNGKSMFTAASQVTPINDGSVKLAKSHPQDTALFAKTGGPFDTLFNHVFAKVDDIYYRMFNSPSTNTPSSFNHNINGRIVLETNGQTFDITKELQTNPLFVKVMTQEIVQQLSRNVNGGKTGMFDYVKSF